jgi:hypothetical protein
VACCAGYCCEQHRGCKSGEQCSLPLLVCSFFLFIFCFLAVMWALHVAVFCEKQVSCVLELCFPCSMYLVWNEGRSISSVLFRYLRIFGLLVSVWCGKVSRNCCIFHLMVSMSSQWVRNIVWRLKSPSSLLQLRALLNFWERNCSTQFSFSHQSL